MGSYRFKTKIQKKTLSPKWHEEFKIPIITWELPNILALEVRDKDRFVDDILGFVSNLVIFSMYFFGGGMGVGVFIVLSDQNLEVKLCFGSLYLK